MRYITCIKKFMMASAFVCLLSGVGGGYIVRAQEFYVTGFTGMSSLLAPTHGMKWRPGFGATLGGGYHLYLNERMFFNMGLDLSYLHNSLRTDSLKDAYTAIDNENEMLDVRYTMYGLRERHNVFMLHVPVAFNFLFGEERNWYAAAGVRVGVPIRSRYKSKVDGLDVLGDYRLMHGDSTVNGPQFAGFGNFEAVKTKGKLPLRLSVEATLEGGYRWQLDENHTLTAGLYFNFGVNNINSDTRQNSHPLEHTPEFGQNGIHVISSMVNSQYIANDKEGRAYAKPFTKRVSPIGFGARVTFTFGQPRNKAAGEAAVTTVVLHDTLYVKMKDTSNVRQPDSIRFKGVVKEDNGKPVQGVLKIYDKDNEVGTYDIKPDGSYDITLPAGKDYAMTIIAKGVMFESTDLPKKPEPRDTSRMNPVVQKDITVKPIAPGVGTILNHVNFEFGKTTLTADSHVALDRIVEWLNENPLIHVEFAGHTDNIGSKAVNDRLSYERAKRIYEYFIGRGIPAYRLSCVGYGFSRPIAPNTTAEGRAKNRRVEMVIK